MTGEGEGQSTETVVGGNDPHRGHRRVCERGVRQGMIKVRLLCFTWLSPLQRGEYGELLIMPANGRWELIRRLKG